MSPKKNPATRGSMWVDLRMPFAITVAEGLLLLGLVALMAYLKLPRLPLIALVGGSEGELAALHSEGLTAVFSINRLPMALADSAPFAERNLEHTMDNILRLLEVQR